MRHQQLYLTNVFGTLSKDDQISGRGRQLIKTLSTRRPNCSVSSLEILTVISTHALEKPPRFWSRVSRHVCVVCAGYICSTGSLLKRIRTPIAVIPSGRHLFFGWGFTVKTDCSKQKDKNGFWGHSCWWVRIKEKEKQQTWASQVQRVAFVKNLFNTLAVFLWAGSEHEQ